LFCPKCGYEYRQGFTDCPDCNVKLVHDPPQEERGEEDFEAQPGRMHYADFIEVMETPDYAFISFVRSLLDAEGLDTYLLGEHVSSVYPMSLGMKLMVRKDHAEEAMRIINDVDSKLDEPASEEYE
jgi:hypothetical protein